MLNINDIKASHATKETTVEVKAWGGEVRVRQLTAAERAEVVSIMQGGSSLVDGKMEVNIGNLTMARIAEASFALVDPAMSRDEIASLGESAIEGVHEICEALAEFGKPKK